LKTQITEVLFNQEWKVIDDLVNTMLFKYKFVCPIVF